MWWTNFEHFELEFSRVSTNCVRTSSIRAGAQARCIPTSSSAFTKQGCLENWDTTIGRRNADLAHHLLKCQSSFSAAWKCHRPASTGELARVSGTRNFVSPTTAKLKDFSRKTEKGPKWVYRRRNDSEKVICSDLSQALIKTFPQLFFFPEYEAGKSPGILFKSTSSLVF